MANLNLPTERVMADRCQATRLMAAARRHWPTRLGQQGECLHQNLEEESQGLESSQDPVIKESIV